MPPRRAPVIPRCADHDYMPAQRARVARNFCATNPLHRRPSSPPRAQESTQRTTERCWQRGVPGAPRRDFQISTVLPVLLLVGIASFVVAVAREEENSTRRGGVARKSKFVSEGAGGEVQGTCRSEERNSKGRAHSSLTSAEYLSTVDCSCNCTVLCVSTSPGTKCVTVTRF